MNDLKVRIYTRGNVSHSWAASPDGEDITPQMLAFSNGQDGNGAYVDVRLPRLDYWTMIVLDYSS
jgi:hypothetical protein